MKKDAGKMAKNMPALQAIGLLEAIDQQSGFSPEGFRQYLTKYLLRQVVPKLKKNLRRKNSPEKC